MHKSDRARAAATMLALRLLQLRALGWQISGLARAAYSVTLKPLPTRMLGELCRLSIGFAND
jgi:hypothetical protein